MTTDPCWIGVDLDGTLAEYHGWVDEEHIGPPVPQMLSIVQDLLDRGWTVKVFTARAGAGPNAIAAIQAWCIQHIGQVLPVTATKDFKMVLLFDDRAVSVEKNTGKLHSPFLLPR